jgi:hypothetical protein
MTSTDTCSFSHIAVQNAISQMLDRFLVCSVPRDFAKIKVQPMCIEETKLGTGTFPNKQTPFSDSSCCDTIPKPVFRYSGIN